MDADTYRAASQKQPPWTPYPKRSPLARNILGSLFAVGLFTLASAVLCVFLALLDATTGGEGAAALLWVGVLHLGASIPLLGVPLSRVPLRALITHIRTH